MSPAMSAGQLYTCSQFDQPQSAAHPRPPPSLVNILDLDHALYTHPKQVYIYSILISHAYEIDPGNISLK